MLAILLLVTVAVGSSGQGMFAVPDGCARASCDAYVEWSLMGSDTIMFELEGTAEGWVAVGVSADRVMGTDGIDDVFVCQRANGDDTVTAEDAYNPQDQTVSPRVNSRDSNQTGFQQMTTSYSGGRISCTFTRSILADNVDEDRNLNEYVYLLLAAGSQRGDALGYHQSTRWPAPTPVLLGNPQGTYSIPTTCDRASCTVYVQWSLMGSDTIRFDLEGTAEGWVAVGVSADRVMGTDGIDDVFVCQRANDSDTVTAEDAYNPQDQTVSPRVNSRDSNQNGFQQIAASYDSGRIACTFTRNILADNVNEDRNLNEYVYLLLAAGPQRGSAIGYHMSTRQPAATPVLLGNPRGTFSIPTTCGRASCMVYVQWAPMGSDTIRFELEGTAEGWVAVGVSADQVMGGDGIDDVFVCQRASGDDTVDAWDAYNPENQTVVPRVNSRDSNQNGFQQVATSYDSGRISCTFTRSILADNVNEDRNLNEDAYLLLAAGEQRGTTIFYHMSLRQSASTPVRLGGPTTTPPPMTQGTFRTPDGCSRSACDVYAQWTLMNANTLEFELEGAAEGWVAIGVSADQRMGGDGIDDVFVCQQASGDDTVTAEDAYNPQDQSTRGNNRDSSQNGFQQISTSYVNGRISCTFTRAVRADNVNEDRNLDESVYLLLAAGPQRGNALMVHNIRRPAGARVVLTEGGSVTAECIDPIIRVHGMLMYLAWILLVPTAYFFAAYMKPAMPGGAWFQIHRALMLIALLPSLAGFILIFVAFRNSGNPNGLIVLGAQNPVGTAHMSFGLVVIILQLINPIIPFCRCKPDSKYRPIFNWIHGKIIGRILIIFAFTAIGLGTWRYSVLVYGQELNVLYIFWIYISFNIVYTVWDTFLYIYAKHICPGDSEKNKKEAKEDSFEMKPMKVESDAKNDKPKKEPSKDAPVRYVFFVLNTLLLVIPGLVIMVLIGYGCIN